MVNLLETTNAVDRMKKLILMISDAAEAYYVDDRPTLTDKEYDALCDELESLEQSTGIVLANSPLHKVMGRVADGFVKVKHTEPMLSAAKTKDIGDIQKWQRKHGDRVVCASWKEDGATCVLRYKEGKLVQALTRGDGYYGEDVTENAKTITNLPLQIPYKDELEIRGECVITRSTYKLLEKIAARKGETIGHARNVASGALRQLDPKKAVEKYLEFKAFNCITPLPDVNSKMKQLDFLQSLGFAVVEYAPVLVSACVSPAMEMFDVNTYPYFADGIIFEIDDLEYGKSLGMTAHHPNNMMAFKWADETEETTFRGVTLNVTRTGTVSLTADFDPVVIENTTVSSATLHNVDYFNALELGVGDKITVYKSNKIIPAVDENLTRSGTYQLPTHCPDCGERLILDGAFLKCPNKSCPSQMLSRLVHFVSKHAMDIQGMSESTLDSLMAAGLIETFDDIYWLINHRKEIVNLEGFGSRKFTKLIDAIEASTSTTMARFITAMGIPFVGREAAKELESHYKGDYFAFFEDAKHNRINIKGFGDVTKQNLYDWANDQEAQLEWMKVLLHLTLQYETEHKEVSHETALSGKKVCVTGSFEGINREEIKEIIRNAGGIPVDSVSKTTDILVAGEKAGSKLNKAQSLGIPIMALDELREVASNV